MSAVLRTSLIGGVLMAIFYIMMGKYHFPFFPFSIIIIPGGMMFTINGFLKPIPNRKKYSYLVGILLSLLYSFLAMGLCMLIVEIYDFGFYFRDLLRLSKNIGTLIGRNIYLILISAFLIPLMYWNQSTEIESNHTDILDEGI